MTAPPFPYVGGKTTLGPRIAALLPEHKHYVEPFAGSLAVLLAKAPSLMETVNDLDADLMTFWRVLREQPDELQQACALTPHSRAEYDAARNRPDDLDDLERARRVWTVLAQSRTGTLRTAGWRHFQATGGSYAGMPGYLRGYVDRMGAAVQRLQRVSLECRPALNVVEDYGRHEEVLLYVDPPYLGTARKWDRLYQLDMPGGDDHRALLDALLACSAAVVLSGYASPLYDDALAGWDRVEMAASTGQGGVYANRTEVLWSNRPIGEPTLFDGEAAS
jgi:DNA adenine methylase